MSKLQRLHLATISVDNLINNDYALSSEKLMAAELTQA
jgi:hypothetical protein